MEHPDTVTFVASTGDEDRAGDIIDQAGWELEHYQKNPVVLLSHSWFAPPVGQSLRTWVERDRLMTTVRFAPTPLGQELALLTSDGYMRAVSVGFRPIQWEVRRDLKTGLVLGTNFHRQELLEISVVSLPANPEALRKALEHPPQSAPGATTTPPDGLIWTSAPTSTKDQDRVLNVYRQIKYALKGGP